MSFAVAKYRAARTQTASPVQIVVQLYEGAIRFLNQAQGAIEAKDFATKGVSLRKAHAIVSELQATLRPEHAPEVCEQLYSLYDFVCMKITEANVGNDVEALESAVGVLSELCEAWRQIAREQNP